MAGSYVTSADGARIAYDLTGSGPGLLLLHGAGKTRKDWHTVGYVARLKEDFTVVTVDMRGSGESTILTEVEDYAIEKLCADLEAVADACELPEFAVWGFSFGGNVARHLGAGSGRVKAIAVIGVPFGPAVDEAFDRYIDAFVEKYAPLARSYREGGLSEAQRKSAIKGRIPVWVACFQAMRQWPVVAPADVKCPALLLAGTKNTSASNWVAQHRAELDRAQVRVETVEGLTHAQEFSQIERVYPLVRAFLAP